MIPFRIHEFYKELKLTFDTEIPETQQRDHKAKQGRRVSRKTKLLFKILS